MTRRPDEGQERLVRDALAQSPWMRGSRGQRLVRCGVLLASWWLVIALIGWALAQAVGVPLVLTVCVANAVLALAFTMFACAKPRVLVRWSVLSMTSSDEDARKGFPGGA